MKKWKEYEFEEKLGLSFLILIGIAMLFVFWPVTVVIAFWYGIWKAWKHWKSKPRLEPVVVPPTLKELVKQEKERFNEKVKVLHEAELDGEVLLAAIDSEKRKHKERMFELLK